MRIVKCDTGHYYDADAYKECPHCAGKAGYEDVATSPVRNRKDALKRVRMAPQSVKSVGEPYEERKF